MAIAATPPTAPPAAAPATEVDLCPTAAPLADADEAEVEMDEDEVEKTVAPSVAVYDASRRDMSASPLRR